MSVFAGTPSHCPQLHIISLYRCAITYVTDPLKSKFYFIFSISNNAIKIILIHLSLWGYHEAVNIHNSGNQRYRLWWEQD